MRSVRHVFSWLGGVAFILICLAVIGVFAYRTMIVPVMAHRIFKTRSASTATPDLYGAPYHAFTIESHGRTLTAWTVDAGPGTPALLLFHGNAETVHDFAQVQAYLYHHHVSSMDFDYSGFGASTGTATIEHLDQDSRAAWRTFARWAGSGHPEFVLGYSLGTAMALHNAPAFQPQPLGVIVYGAFTSARNAAWYITLGLPHWLLAITPDPWDNVEAAARLREPLLVVAGMNDVKIPPAMGRRVALFAHDGGDFVLVPDAGHRGIVNKMKAVWTPILGFMDQRVADASGYATSPDAATHPPRGEPAVTR